MRIQYRSMFGGEPGTARCGHFESSNDGEAHRRSSPACQRQVPFSSAVHGPDVALEMASCAHTLHAKHASNASNASLRHISRHWLPSDGNNRDVVILAELLGRA